MAGAFLEMLPGDWYTGDESFDRILCLELALVSSTIFGMFMVAPYGKHANDSLGSVHLSPRIGWWLMELPATVAFVMTYAMVTPPADSEIGPSPRTSYLLALLFLVHYSNRGWYFPFKIRVAHGRTQSFGLVVSLIGAIFTGLHGHLNARMFRSLGTHYTDSWLTDPRFLVGLLIYQVGFWVTIHSEYVMRELRPENGVVSESERYKIPRGGAFEFVTSAQYLGELTAWAGFAIFTWSVPGVAVFAISSFNLVPRAFQNHNWYLKKFGDDYKKLRRTRLIPFIL